MLQPKTYTPKQATEILQLSKNTVYKKINREKVIAEKIGKVYRIPQSSISFVFIGMGQDILKAQKKANLKKVKRP
jgi:excisionase family DNA binding protein